MENQSNVDHAKLGRLISEGYSLREAFVYSGGRLDSDKKDNTNKDK